jgi:hypothetical protein
MCTTDRHDVRSPDAAAEPAPDRLRESRVTAVPEVPGGRLLVLGVAAATVGREEVGDVTGAGPPLEHPASVASTAAQAARLALRAARVDGTTKR